MTSVKRSRRLARRASTAAALTPPAPREHPRATRLLHLLLLIVLPALAFSNSLGNGYHLDDLPRVSENLELEHFWPPTRFFTDVRTGSNNPALAEYRPLMPLTHSAEIQISRALGVPRLAVFHVGNIAIHIASAILLYFLFLQLMTLWVPSVSTRLGDDTAHAAFAGALIFGVHPIAGAAVNYIVGLDLLQMTFFMLASVLVYLRMRRQRETVAGWMLCLVLLWLAILAKQEAIVVFAFIFLFEVMVARTRLTDGKLWIRTGLFALPTAAYFVFRAVWISKQNPEDALRVPVGVEYPLTMLKAHLFYYLRNFVWPFEMRALGYFEPVTSLANPAALVGLAFIVGTLAAAWWCYRRMPLLSFAILAYWLLFALTSSIFPFLYLVTDYRQYVPLAFLSLAIVLACFTWTRRPVAMGLLAVFVMYSSVSSYYINTHWKTEESFWLQSVKYGGTDIAHVNYAFAVTDRDPVLGEQHLKEARRQNPYNFYANTNLGILYIQQGKTEEGLALLRDVVMRNPTLALGHYRLARGLDLVVQRTAAQTEEELAAFKRAAELAPLEPNYNYWAGRVLQSAGDPASSIPYLERVVDKGADYEFSIVMLAFAHQKRGNDGLAIAEYQRYLTVHPEHPQAHFNLALAAAGRGDCMTAIEHFEKALELRPEYIEAHLHLAKCYRSVGNESAAARHDALYKAPPPGEVIGTPLPVAPGAPGVDSPEDLLNTSLRLYRAGNYQGSIDMARKALALKPDYAEAHNNIAAGLAQLGKWDEAAAAAREALRLKPDFPLARNNLAWAERERQKVTK